MAASPLSLGPRRAELKPILQSIDMSRPPTPIVSHTAVDLKTRRSLQDAWKEAAESFKRETGRDLHSEESSSADGFLEAWASRSDHDDSEDVKKKRKIVTAVTNCLAGLSAIGDMIAQAASISFPGAGLCFSAIGFLFKTPTRISAVYDGLLDLFSEVEEFLVRFKILKRIDRTQGLDAELVESASNMLLSFIKICLLACKVLEKDKLKTMIKVAFNADPGIAGALTTFQGLAKKLDSLTTTLVFEHIRSTEEVVVKIENVVEESRSVIKATDARMGTIEASFKEVRRRDIDTDRLTSIRKAIFTADERAMWDQIRQSSKPDIDLLPNTYDALEKQAAFQKWYSSAAHVAILALIGEAESGKSYMIESLKQKLEAMQRAAREQDPKVYVACHDLRPHRIRLAERKKKLGSFTPFALRSMAVQIAEQVPSYAQELDQRLSEDKRIREMSDLGRLWKVLGLSTYSASHPTIMYLFFEGVEHENESSIEALLKILVEDRRAGTNTSSQIRILITGDARVSSRLVPSVSKIDMEALQKFLTGEYVSRTMKDLALFQDSDPRSVAWREKVVAKLQESDRRSFRDMKQKLERIQVAVRDDLVSEVDRILDDEGSQGHNKEARELLDKVASDLRPTYVIQVNRIIAWLLYSQPGWPLEVHELEAMLHIGPRYESLTGLAHKIDNDFAEILKRTKDYVDLHDGLEDALRESATVPYEGLEETRPRVSMNIAIKNVDLEDVRAFITQLNMQVSSHAFDFETSSLKHDNKIYANELRGHLDIVRTCLQLLNGGWAAHTRSLLYYSCEYLPLHLASLAQIAGLNDDPELLAMSDQHQLNGVSDDEARSIGQGLVSLLSDPYYLVQSKDYEFGTGEYWLAESEGVGAVRLWLRTTRHLLQPHEQRWVDNALDEPDVNNLRFMEDFVRALGRKWVTKPTGLTYHGRQLFSWVDKYIEHKEKASEDLEHESTSQINQTDYENDESDHEESDDEVEEEPGREPDSVSESHDGLNGLPDGATADVNGQSLETTEHDEEARPETLQHCDDVTDNNKNVDGAVHENTNSVVEDGDDVAAIDPIDRAVNWLEQEKVEFTKDATFHICVGYTYLEQVQPKQAIEHFEVAQNDPLHRGLALAGLGIAQRNTGDKAMASQTLLKAIAVHEEDQTAEDYEDSERLAYVNFLNDAAVVLEELGDYKEAMMVDEKIVGLTDELSYAFKTLLLACKIDREEYAMQLLTSWAQKQDGQDLRDRLYSYIASDPRAEIFQLFIFAIRSQAMRDMVSSILDSAVTAVDRYDASHVKPPLMHLQGILSATGVDEVYWQTAAELWERVLELITMSGKYEDDGYDVVYFQAARSLAGYRFTSIRNELPKQAEELAKISPETAQRLHDVILESVLDLPLTCWNRLDHPDCYAHSLSMILGQKDHGQAHATKTLEFALQVLTDDDTENDVYGYFLLLRFMCFMGDKVGALTTATLFDRKAFYVENHDTDYELNDGEDEGPYKDTSSYKCDGCFLDVTWFQTEGIFKCQFCPQFDLCARCYKDFISGRLRLHICSPTHEFVHLYHTEYSKEEVAPNMVRIGWNWVDLGDDKFAREGGRIVSLQDWVTELRTTWGLPDPTDPGEEET